MSITSITDFSTYSREADYWTLNPQSLAWEETKKLAKDKDGSDVMWVVAFVCDYYSRYFNIKPDEERQKMVSRDIFGDDAWWTKNYKRIKDVVTKYHRLQYDSERRYLDIWNQKADEIATVLNTAKVTLENMKDIRVELEGYAKLLAAKDKIIERIEAQEAGTQVKGGGQLGLLESGKGD